MVYFQPSTDKHGTNDIKSDHNPVLQPAPNVSPLQIQDTPEAKRNTYLRAENKRTGLLIHPI